MKQTLMGGTLSDLDTIRYVAVDRLGDSTDNNRTVQEMPIPIAGVLRNLLVNTDQVPGSGSNWVFTLHVNGSDTALAATVADGTTSGSDTSDSISVSAGDLIVMRIHRTGAATTGTGIHAAWALEFEPTTANRAVWFGGDTFAPVFSGTTYGAIGGYGSSHVSTTEANARVMWGINARIKALYMYAQVAPGVGNSREFTIMLNGVATGNTVTIADGNGSASDTTLDIAIVPGDELSLRQVEVNSPSNSAIKYGIAYAPSNDGEWCRTMATGTNYSDGVYIDLEGTFAETATEGNRKHGADPAGSGNPIQVRDMRMKFSVAPGVGKSRTLTLRKSGASSPVAITISGTDTTGTSTGKTNLGASDTLNWLHNESGGPAAATVRTAFVLGPPGGSGNAGGGGGRGRGPGGGGGGGGGGTGPLNSVALKKMRFPEKII